MMHGQTNIKLGQCTYMGNIEALSRNHCCRDNKWHIFWVCVCSLSYLAWKNACAILYCHLWPGPLYHILPYYLIKIKIFEKKLLNTKCVFWFSLQLLS